MLKFFVRRPITTLMFVLVCVVLGLVSESAIHEAVAKAQKQANKKNKK